MIYVQTAHCDGVLEIGLEAGRQEMGAATSLLHWPTPDSFSISDTLSTVGGAVRKGQAPCLPRASFQMEGGR